LLAGNLPIDLVYNRLTDFYLQDTANNVLLEAHIADLVVMTPHPRAHALYANKSNLVTLTSSEALLSIGVSDDTIGVLRRGIPNALAVNEADASQWWAQRKDWFFKPESGFGSKGTYRGDKITRSVFANVLRDRYVAQQVAPPSERAQNDWSILKFDIRNYTYEGNTILSAARLYQGQTTNFRTAGGGFAPIYVVDQAPQ
jgi:hypothetical protein